ncbi:hypothetical protein D3C79_957060 [compost metagenome]
MAERVAIAGEHKGAVATDRLHALQQGQRLRGEWNTMGAFHLHSIGGYVPNPVIKIDLIPTGARRFTRAHQGVKAPFNLATGGWV